MGTPPQRVMCVEDDEDIRLIVEFSLGSVGGFEVLCCASGAEALQRVEAFAPDLVLLDVMMPHMSGPETLQALRKLDSLRHVPVVFMTAKAMPQELESLLPLGATGIIVKPFDPTALPAHVRLYLDHAHGRPA
jgi:CheY-like chemotaxis protein